MGKIMRYQFITQGDSIWFVDTTTKKKADIVKILYEYGGFISFDRFSTLIAKFREIDPELTNLEDKDWLSSP